jgi:hypothetical protein
LRIGIQIAGHTPAKFLAIFLIIGLVACRQAAGGVPLEGSAPGDDAPDIRLMLSPAADTTPVMGSQAWTITLTDVDGAPVEDAIVSVRGDMNHAGMVPVESAATHDGQGIYSADFEWTMAGDWIVTVTATLADGRVKSATFDYTVAVR